MIGHGWHRSDRREGELAAIRDRVEAQCADLKTALEEERSRASADLAARDAELVAEREAGGVLATQLKEARREAVASLEASSAESEVAARWEPQKAITEDQPRPVFQ